MTAESRNAADVSPQATGEMEGIVIVKSRGGRKMMKKTVFQQKRSNIELSPQFLSEPQL